MLWVKFIQGYFLQWNFDIFYRFILPSAPRFVCTVLYLGCNKERSHTANWIKIYEDLLNFNYDVRKNGSLVQRSPWINWQMYCMWHMCKYQIKIIRSGRTKQSCYHVETVQAPSQGGVKLQQERRWGHSLKRKNLNSHASPASHMKLL